jgi:hypothetical protein
MPNQKERKKKKGGKNKSKKMQAMRDANKKRKTGGRKAERRGPFRKGLSDQPDIQDFKPGAADDKNMKPRAH